MTREAPGRRRKATALTSAVKRRCLEMIEDGEFITDIAARLNVARQSLYRARIQDNAFRRAWDKAAKIGRRIQADEAEREMDLRGRIGWLEPKFYEGKICGLACREFARSPRPSQTHVSRGAADLHTKSSVWMVCLFSASPGR